MRERRPTTGKPCRRTTRRIVPFRDRGSLIDLPKVAEKLRLAGICQQRQKLLRPVIPIWVKLPEPEAAIGGQGNYSAQHWGDGHPIRMFAETVDRESVRIASGACSNFQRHNVPSALSRNSHYNRSHRRLPASWFPCRFGCCGWPIPTLRLRGVFCQSASSRKVPSSQMPRHKAHAVSRIAPKCAAPMIGRQIASQAKGDLFVQF